MPLTPAKIDAEFGTFGKALQAIFGDRIEARKDYDRDDAEEHKGPHSVSMTAPNAPETINVLTRLEEYVYNRPLTVCERANRDRQREESYSPLEEHALVLPWEIYSAHNALPRLREFIFSRHEAGAIASKEGIHLRVPADEAAVALSHWTGIPWHIRLAGERGFKQIRIETEHDIANVGSIRLLMQQARMLPREVHREGRRLFVPVSYFSAETVQQLREATPHPGIATLAHETAEDYCPRR